MERKYGILSLGKQNIDGKNHIVVVAPYTKGRSIDDKNSYTIAKGDQKPDEAGNKATKREFSEETGIDIDKLQKVIMKGIHIT